LDTDLTTDLKEVAPEAAGPNLLEILSVIWLKRQQIAKIAFITAVIAAGVSLIIPESYEATATVMPQFSQGEISGLSALSNLSSLAGLPGSEVPLSELYPSIMLSRSVLREVLYHKYTTTEHPRPADLVEWFNIEADTPELTFEKAIANLSSLLTVDLDRKTQIIMVSIRTGDPDLSAQVVQRAIDATDEFVRTKQNNYASEQRKWIDARLVEVKDDLRRSEDALKRFQQQNRAMANSPDLQMEQMRLQRDVTINSSLYVELRQQYELVRIDEIKNIPIMNTLDPPKPPALRIWPRRTLITIGAFLLAIMGACGFVYVDIRYGKSVRAVVRVFDVTPELEAIRSFVRRIFSRRRSGRSSDRGDA